MVNIDLFLPKFDRCPHPASRPTKLKVNRFQEIQANEPNGAAGGRGGDGAAVCQEGRLSVRQQSQSPLSEVAGGEVHGQLKVSMAGSMKNCVVLDKEMIPIEARMK